ncbi:MAG: hypothetical protein NC543_05915 [bacterium]|nr:hypothetical protein [bacterium]MCM1374505.1 hypothetical protein [Muribaculum sp.]
MSDKSKGVEDQGDNCKNAGTKYRIQCISGVLLLEKRNAKADNIIYANLTVEKEKWNAEFLTDQAANPLTSRQISCTICKNMTKGYEEKSR